MIYCQNMLEMEQQQFKLVSNDNNKHESAKSKDLENRRKSSFINFKEGVLQATK